MAEADVCLASDAVAVRRADAGMAATSSVIPRAVFVSSCWTTSFTESVARVRLLFFDGVQEAQLPLHRSCSLVRRGRPAR